MNWIIYALLSATMAAITAIACKVGGNQIDSIVAATGCTVTMALVVMVMALCLGKYPLFSTVPLTNTLIIILSGIAGGLGWFFYFSAMRGGPASKVVAIDRLSLPMAIVLSVLVLGETMTPLSWLGLALMVCGSWLVVG